MESLTLSGASFAIVANGFADGPAQALRDFLVERRATVLTAFHPLSPEQPRRHLVEEFAGGMRTRSRALSIPLRPPLSFGVDPFVPLWPRAVDVWLGFNPLAAARGLVARRIGRAGRTVLWSVDFVPDRFGGSPLTRLYDRLDRWCCRAADARVELSEAAREARDRHHGLPRDLVPTHIVPMGAWLDRVPTVPDDGYERRRVVFLGHLVQRQGVALLLEALERLRAGGADVRADIVGDGPLASELRAKAAPLGDAVRFHGFVEDHRHVEQLLANASIAVAPYEPSGETFTRFADPGKLKAYLAAGLPVVLTDVPPTARELEERAGAEIVRFDPDAFAAAIGRGLGDPERWQERREAARTYARRFDWDGLLGELLEKLGFED